MKPNKYPAIDSKPSPTLLEELLGRRQKPRARNYTPQLFVTVETASRKLGLPRSVIESAIRLGDLRAIVVERARGPEVRVDQGDLPAFASYLKNNYGFRVDLHEELLG